MIASAEREFGGLSFPEAISHGAPEYLRPHLLDSARLAVGWGAWLELSASDTETLRCAALFHDIGKMAMPEAITLKPGPLTPLEQQFMREHVRLGAQMLQPYVPVRVYRVVYQHHESIDGTGYPLGLPGVSLDPLARRLAIIDAFSAMTEDRPYAAARTALEAAQELVRCSGRQFDSQYVQEFVTWLGTSGG